MSASAARSALDLRSVEQARRAAVRAGATDLTAPAEAVKDQSQSAPRSRGFRLRRPRRSLGTVSKGIAAGLLAVGIIAAITPRLPAKLGVPLAAPVAAASVPAPTSPPAASAAKAAVPTDRLRIPTLGINAPVRTIGLVDGALDAPKTLWQVGLYTGGAKPGDPGTAIIDGHSGAPGQVGVFEHLSRLQVGALITYTYASGHAVTFRVTSSASYPVSQATATLLFAQSAAATLNLISCAGHWDAGTQAYDQRWIVTATAI